MKIVVANSAGFCMGVRRAVEQVLGQLSSGKKEVLTLGPLIHNPQAIDMLSKKKARVIDSPEEYTAGTVVIRTHGITPEKRLVLEGRNADIVDATCPRVRRVQQIIHRHALKGFATVIIGDHGHPEVEGLMGYAQGRGIVVGSLAEAKAHPIPSRLIIVGQTTLDRNRFKEISAHISQHAAECVVFDTLCDSTSKRQEELKRLCEEVDGVIVVGGKQSANTQRLVHISSECGKPAFHIETEEELKEIDLLPFATIGVTAGTSTPNWMINRVVDRLEELAAERKRPLLSLPSRLFKAAIKSNAVVSAGGGFLSVAACALLGVKPVLTYSLIVSLYLFGMHLINQLSDMRALEINHPARIVFFRKNRNVLLLAGSAGAVLALFLASSLGAYPFLVVLIASVMGLAYNLRIPGLPFLRLVSSQRLSTIPGSKDVLVATAWATVTVGVPWMHVGRALNPLGLAAAFLFVFVMAFSRTIFMNIRDIQGDRMLGKETFPTVLGRAGSRRLSVLSVVAAAAFITVLAIQGTVPTVGFVLLPALLFVLGYLSFLYERLLELGILTEGVIDSGLILSGILALGWEIWMR